MLSSALSASKSAVANGHQNVSSFLQNYGSGMSRIMNITNANNAWSAAQAETLRGWQEEQNRKAMEFNAAEAAKNRDWQKMMSDTAHQREVHDLIAAGLNPVLSVTGGNGASVGSGATASGVTSSGAKGDTDMSASTALVSLLGNLLSQQTQLLNTNTNAVTNLAIADKYTAMQKYTAELQSQTQLTTANISAMATQFAATTGAEASKAVAAINQATSKYGTDVNAMTQKEIAEFNAEVNKELKKLGVDADFNLQDERYGWELLMKRSGYGLGSETAQLSALIGDRLNSFMGRDYINQFTNSGKAAKAYSSNRSGTGGKF